MDALTIELLTYWPGPVVGLSALAWWVREYGRLPSPRPPVAWWMLGFRLAHAIAASGVYAATVLRYVQDDALTSEQAVLVRAAIMGGVFGAQIVDLAWIFRRRNGNGD